MSIIEKLELLLNKYDSDSAKEIDIFDIQLTDLNHFMGEGFLKEATIFFDDLLDFLIVGI